MKARGSSSSNLLFIAVAVLVVLAGLAYTVWSAQPSASSDRPRSAPQAIDDAYTDPATPESISAAIDGALDEAVAATPGASGAPADTDDLSLLPAATATGSNSIDRSTLAPTATRRATRTPRPTRTPRATATALAERVDDSLVMRDQRIYALDGSLAYRGDVDLQPVLDRIEAGERDRHPNDGSVFANREGRLPRKPRGYYTEWVIRTPGLREVGPQRLVTGQQGEVYYTPDHYDSFVRVR